MAREVRSFEVTTPAGTTQAAPLVTSLAFPPRTVTAISIRVPPGPSGALGFYLACSGGQILPRNPGEWIITDNEVINWPLTDFPDSGSWQAVTYNTGTLPHTLYLRFMLDLVSGPGAGAFQPLPAGQLVGSV